MTRKLIRLSQRYVAALRRHLKQGPGATPAGESALRLGRQALALGLETLELARIHERALTTPGLSDGTNGTIKRAEIFFTEAIIPIVGTHRAARQSQSALGRVNRTLDRCTAELDASNRQLQRVVVRRKSVKTALKKSGEHYTRLLKQSLKLPEGLRHLTRRILLAQEKERHAISHQLQDDIARTLLVIQVRLLALKSTGDGNAARLGKEIAGTQRLVEDSIRSIRRFARELSMQGQP
jgi:signal transduction histidine kinase